MLIIKHNGYVSSHPWYYKTGGQILSPRTISRMAYMSAKGQVESIESDNHVFSTEVEKAVTAVTAATQNKLIEAAIEHHKYQLMNVDLPRYRTVVRNLRRYRKTGDGVLSEFSDIFSSVSYKHNHLYWHFRNLSVLHLFRQGLPQGDLFGF